LNQDKLDTTYLHETPEGIDLEIKVAGAAPRACAWLIDILIRFAIYIVLTILFSRLEGIGDAIIFISIFLIEWFYHVIFEVYRGATPGKKQMGLIVVNDNGTPISWSSSLIRNLLLAVDFLPFMYGFGLLSLLFSQNFKRLGDYAAGTLVVYQHKPPSALKYEKITAQVPPPYLKTTDRITILNYLERAPQLSTERRIELANILQSITKETGKVGEQKLMAYGIWLMGEGR